MTASWCPRLRHLADGNVQVKEEVSSGVAANAAGPRRDVAGNSPAHALSKSELAYDLGPSRQGDDDAWQPSSTTKGAPGGSIAAAGGVPRNGDHVGAKNKQAWLGADSGWYDQSEPSWKSTDIWSSKTSSDKGWDSAQSGWWADNVSRAAWPPAVPIGADENAHKKSSSSRSPKEEKVEPKRQQGKAAPYASAAAVAPDSASAAVGAAAGAAVPSEAKGKFGKKAARKDAGLKWVEKGAVSDQPTEPAGDLSSEAVKREAISKQRPILQWRAVGRGRGGGCGDIRDEFRECPGEAVEVASDTRGRGRRAGR